MKGSRVPRALALASAFVIAALVALAVQPPAPAAARVDPHSHRHSLAAVTSTQVVPVTLREMSIALSVTTVLAGKVTFAVTNTGTVTHELVLLRTDRLEDQIPAGDESPQKASESATVGEIDDVTPGATKVATFILAAGHYVLICNEPGHYAAGMRATFLVATPVTISLSEMNISLDTTQVPAGPVLFAVKNAGTVTHELVVLRTDNPPAGIPSGDEPGKVSEDGWVGETDDIQATFTTSLLLRLQPGNYVLICNEPGHYAAGMRVAFTVIPPEPQPSYIEVNLQEMAITIDQRTVLAGTVRFLITNSGTVTHELVVIRTDLADDQLPARPNDPGKVSELGAVGEADDIDPGRFVGLELNLAPGHYVLACNQIGHYKAGMHISLTVLPQPNDGEVPDEGGGD